MANQKGTGTTWNLPNYAGDLFTADTTNTPILSAIGGLTGGVQTDNFEFPTDSQYSLPEAAQPAITETASLTAPQAEEIVRTQNTNVTQIFHEKVSISYVKESNRGRMSGLNTAGQKNNVQSTEKDWQIARKLEKIARDIEYTIINGVYAKATSADVASKTRGLLALCGGDGGTKVDGKSAALTKALMQQLFKAMYDAGAIFSNGFCMWAALRSRSSPIFTPTHRLTEISEEPISSRLRRTSETSVLLLTVLCRRPPFWLLSCL